MVAFLVTYTTASGKERELTLEAETAAAARTNLRRRGILPSRMVPKDSVVRPSSAPVTPPVAPTGRSETTKPGLFERSVSVKDKALFAGKLSALVTAGVPILRGLELMRNQQKSAALRRALAAITVDVNEGGSLASSMRRWPKVFDKLSVAMVEAGETGGVLDDTLKRLATLLEDNARLQNQIKSAMGYPLTVLVLAVAMFLGMTIFLIPTFADIFQQLDADLPVFTQFMLQLSKLMRSWFSLLLLAILSLALFAFQRFRATPDGRLLVDGWVLKLPLFGEMAQKNSTAQFCRTLSSLSRAGVPILRSMEILKETTTNAVISEAIVKSGQDVSEGIPLSTALATKGVFPEMAISLISIGEETGEMDSMLAKVADFYEDEVATDVKTMTSMLEPAMIVLVGVIVGSVLVAMYLPMFSVFEKIR